MSLDATLDDTSMWQKYKKTLTPATFRCWSLPWMLHFSSTSSASLPSIKLPGTSHKAPKIALCTAVTIHPQVYKMRRSLISQEERKSICFRLPWLYLPFQENMSLKIGSRHYVIYVITLARFFANSYSEETLH